MFRSRLCSAACLAAVSLTFSGVAYAERPMNVDDAGTLDKGGAKVEFGWSRDDHARGFEGAVGYGPIENVEVELNYGGSRDSEPNPSERARALGMAIKWVPLQSEVGLSAGLKYEYGNEDVEGAKGHAQALIGLMTWAFQGGQLVHLNIGREFARAERDTEAENTWGVGLDWPLTDAFHATVESFGTQHGAPDRAVGLRYEIVEGLKVSGAVGRGNDRSFANLGVAWEF